MSKKIESIHDITINEWDYGRTIYEDGKEIPWMKLNHNSGKVCVWENGQWMIATKYHSTYKGNTM